MVRPILRWAMGKTRFLVSNWGFVTPKNPNYTPLINYRMVPPSYKLVYKPLNYRYIT